MCTILSHALNLAPRSWVQLKSHFYLSKSACVCVCVWGHHMLWNKAEIVDLLRFMLLVWAYIDN